MSWLGKAGIHPCGVDFLFYILVSIRRDGNDREGEGIDAGKGFMAFAAMKPSIPGITRSMRMASKVLRSDFSKARMAALPLLALEAVAPASSSVAMRISWLKVLSSTTSTWKPQMPSSPVCAMRGDSEDPCWEK